MTVCDLSDKSCVPCEGGVPPIGEEEARIMMKELDAGWQLVDGAVLKRRLEFKGFAKPVYHANLAAFLGDQEGHHPDIAFGWGYCEVTFTTHAIGGLSENDFICAAKFDKMLATA
jgi:4a-hydroxytetrahydrobiopterin dehydratase